MEQVRVTPNDWATHVDDVDGPQLIVAGPGAGKTEFLVRRAIHLIEELGVAPDQVLILSFSRRTVADLRLRLTEAITTSITGINATTFHSLAFRLLETYAPVRFGWEQMPSLLTSPEQVALVSELLAAEEPGSWPVLYRPLLHTATFANEVADFMLRCQELLIGPEQLAGLARQRQIWRGLPQFMNSYERALEDRHRLDYGSVQTKAVALLQGVAIEGLHRYVLVDEYQDTTAAQAKLLDALTKSHRNLTVAGDPYQSIYGFRGARVENIDHFPRTFRQTDGSPARRIVLTTSHRVPEAVLASAVRLTTGLDLPGAAGPVEAAPGRGRVVAHKFHQQSHEADWIASEAQRLHLRDRIPYRRMAVLVRSKRRFVPELLRALDRRSIPFDPPTERLVDQPAVQMVLDSVSAAVGDDRDSAIRRLLLGPLFGLPLAQYRELERSPEPWPELLADAVPEGGALASLVSSSAWASERSAAEGFWHLWTTLPQFRRLVHGETGMAMRAAWASFSQVLDRLRERDPSATLRDVARWSTDEEFEATPLYPLRPKTDDRLIVTTLHQAKGLEVDVVFIADARDGVFPDLRPRASLLEPGLLTADDHADAAALASRRLQEEARLAYTAVSRAARAVIWTVTTTGFDDGEGLPSRFIGAAVGDTDSPFTPIPAEGPPVTASEVEAHLRRVARDPLRPAAIRMAAMALLTTPAPWQPRPATSFAGVLQPGPDVGLVPEKLRLSPTQAEEYGTCPRRYAFRKRLGIEDDTSMYLAFGSIVHDALEQAEGAAIERELPHATLESALECLASVWDDLPFVPFQAAWRARAERVVTHLYEQWPSTGHGVHAELDVEMEIAGTEWRGRIDRVERRDTDGRLAVVDYKTGTRIPTKGEAAESIQLGFYALAVEAAGLGDVGAAELWFPAAKSTSVTTRALDLSRLDAIRDQMEDIAAGIAAEMWEARPGKHCERCPVRLVCPAWPEGRESYA